MVELYCEVAIGYNPRFAGALADIAARVDGHRKALGEAALGLGRMFALHCRSSTSYQIREYIRCLYLSFSEATMRPNLRRRTPRSCSPWPAARRSSSSIIPWEHGHEHLHLV